MKQAHKHNAVIKAWADGASIQFLDKYNTVWQDCRATPEFRVEAEYRVKNKHQSAMDAHAAGKEIEFRAIEALQTDPWYPCDGEPYWFDNLEYRVRVNKWQHVLDAQEKGLPVQAKWKGTDAWVTCLGGLLCNDEGAEYRVKHKHQDVIDAHAAGMVIEFKSKAHPYNWRESHTSPAASLLGDSYEWRVKPILINQDMLDARANGETIQFKSKLVEGNWIDVSASNPMQGDYEYRIKMLNQDMLDARAAGKVIEHKSKCHGDWVETGLGDDLQDDYEYRIQTPPVHPHEAMRLAHQAGSKIEYYSCIWNDWKIVEQPLWTRETKYRIYVNPVQPFIDAHARGEEVQFESKTGKGIWIDVHKKHGCDWGQDFTYRIKVKNQHVIDAQEACKAVQFLSKITATWIDAGTSTASHHPDYEWRIKPDAVKFRPALMKNNEGTFWVSVEKFANRDTSFVRFIGDEVEVEVAV